MGWQGLAKVDWVTVWFFCMKVKSTESPGWAFYEHSISAGAANWTLNVTDHKLRSIREACGAAHGHVILDSSHPDHCSRKESRERENVGGAHVVGLGEGEGEWRGLGEGEREVRRKKRVPGVL